MKTDLEIQQETVLLPIEKVAEEAGIHKTKILPYGNYMAKVTSAPAKRPAKRCLLRQ